MADKTVSRTDLVGLTSLSFIRPIKLTYDVSGTKPNTRLYVFFDGVNVDKHITPDGGTLGQAVITDSAGNAKGVFDIPPMTFNTGRREIKFQDSDEYDLNAIPGATLGSATAFFTSAGLLRTLQETITNTTIIQNNIIAPPPAVRTTVFQDVVRQRFRDGGGRDGDPLAQTFFTYGISGGCFITKIDLFFQSKDPNVPMMLQIREVVNGYPGPNALTTVYKTPAQIVTSANASAATTFEFDFPMYLPEDSEFCFVLLSNSNKYNMWTSELGKKSVETGKVIFEQPHIGSLFKSENNTTWTASQTEDIKFTLYKAKFTIGEREVQFKANAPQTLIMGNLLSVTSGSPVVTAKFDFHHGFITGDKIYFSGQTGANYRGISSAAISNVAGFSITRINDYELTFNVGVNATSTGTLETSGILNAIQVDNAGSGYVSPVITIAAPTGPGGGTTATATATVVGGQIISVNITDPGSGYIETPSYTLTDASGTGAILAPISEGMLVAAINKRFQALAPLVSVLEPPQTSITNTIRTCSENYILGLHQLHDVETTLTAGQDALLVTSQNETARMGTNASTQMFLRMSTDNSNVSPMIDISMDIPRLQFYNFLINSRTAGTNEHTNDGNAYSRYISKPVTLETVSVGARVFVNAASVDSTWFDVYIRTSLTSSDTDHTEGEWTLMQSDTDRNLSSVITEYKDYEFYVEPTEVDPFDVYDIKIVLYAQQKHVYPVINNYRVIILAT